MTIGLDDFSRPGHFLGREPAALQARSQRAFDRLRVCVVDGCRTRLSMYNPKSSCWLHQPASIPRSAVVRKSA
jgi:hypothetical protein